MKEKEERKIEQPEEKMEQRQPEEAARKAGRAIFLLVALLFAAVMSVTYFFEANFGKTAGTVSLVLIAVIIAFCLYRKEIVEKLKRKK